MAAIIATFSTSCSENRSNITLDSLHDEANSERAGVYRWTVIDQATNIDYGGSVAVGDSVAVPNGTFRVRVLATYVDGGTGSSAVRTLLVNCEQSTPSPVTLLVSWNAPSPPPAGGYEVQYRVLNSTDPYTVAQVASSPFSTIVPRGYAFEVIVRAICGPGKYSTALSYP